jgi:class 3 adenylate cyclase
MPVTEPLASPSSDLSQDYSRLWFRAVRNLLLGSLISILPAFAFYTAAFHYTPRQFRILLVTVFPLSTLASLALDVALNRWYLAAFRGLARGRSADIATVHARLHNFPLFSFVRVFGPHALTASSVAQVAVLWANARWALGISSGDYWVYWLLNLTLVPIGHAVFEYHANGWAARDALRRLAEVRPLPAPAPGIRRVGLATRLAVFYTMLAISPLILLAAAARLGHAPDAAGYAGWTDSALVIAGVTAVNLLLLLLFASDVNHQTRVLVECLGKVEEGDLKAHADVYSPDEFGAVSDGVNKMIRGLRDRQRIRDLFGVYVSPEISRAILDNEVALQGESREVSVLFCDLRNFTRFSASRTPAQVVERLNEFFSRMAGAIDRHGGTINKFLGDGFLAIFGAPVRRNDHARRAIEAALAMEQELQKYNEELRARGEPEMNFGVGIDSGEVIAGNVGSSNRLEYTVIGDAANRSSRIEQLTKTLGARILVSERAYQCSGLAGGTPLPPVEVKGIAEPLRVVAMGKTL